MVHIQEQATPEELGRTVGGENSGEQSSTSAELTDADKELTSSFKQLELDGLNGGYSNMSATLDDIETHYGVELSSNARNVLGDGKDHYGWTASFDKNGNKLTINVVTASLNGDDPTYVFSITSTEPVELVSAKKQSELELINTLTNPLTDPESIETTLGITFTDKSKLAVMKDADFDYQADLLTVNFATKDSISFLIKASDAA